MPAEIRIPSKLAPHEHACHFFGSEKSFFGTVVPYVFYGLTRGEKCLLALDNFASDSFRDALSSYGCDVRKHEKSEQLEILSTRKTYFGFGMFSGAAMLAYYRAYIPAILGNRFRGIRVAVEIADSLLETNASREFSIYEIRANELFSGNRVSAICAYDSNKFPESFLAEIAESHPFHMVQECSYLPLNLQPCFHSGYRSDTHEQATQYCFDNTEQFRHCPVFQEFEAQKAPPGQ